MISLSMNSLVLDEDEYFSMTANIESPGYQRIVLKGNLVKRTSNGTYVASLLPQMFYGADGLPLTTWRQYLPTAGSQVILSRGAGGYPKVPDEEIYWRKVADTKTTPAGMVVPTKAALETPNWLLPVVAILGAVAVIYLASR